MLQYKMMIDIIKAIKVYKIKLQSSELCLIHVMYTSIYLCFHYILWRNKEVHKA